MCKYCASILENTDLVPINEEAVTVLNERVVFSHDLLDDSKTGKPVMSFSATVGTKLLSFNTQINFCPMCGTKLQ